MACTTAPIRSNTFSFALTTEMEILNAVSSLKMINAVDLDWISTYFLKLLGPIIVKPLAYRINKSVENRIFPDLLKMGKVLPIPKKITHITYIIYVLPS